MNDSTFIGINTLVDRNELPRLGINNLLHMNDNIFIGINTLVDLNEFP